MLKQHKTLQKNKTAFLDFIQADLKLQTLSTKLNHWYDLTWDEFKTELKKAKVVLDVKQANQWFDIFSEKKQAALLIKSEIEQTDKLIDNMVYQLYGLTEEEISIIENKD